MNSGARRILAACVASRLFAGFAPRARAAMSSLDSLVAAERAFSALSVERGMKTAFLTYLAPEGVVFAPTAENGRSTWETRADAPGTLRWTPETAEISAAGDLGWTTGPWEFAASGHEPHETAHGQFVSVWRRQADGTYRVAADLGVSHAPRSDRAVDAVKFRPGPSHEGAEFEKKGVHATSLDHALGERSRRTTIGMAFETMATTDVRLNLEGEVPRVGRLEADGALDTLDGAWHFAPTGSAVARSEDLLFTFGTVSRWHHGAKAAVDTCAYLHVWRRDIGNRWELAVAVHKPVK